MSSLFKFCSLDDEAVESLNIQALVLELELELNEIKILRFLRFAFTITDKYVYYHYEDNLYDGTYGNLYDLMTYNNYQYVRFPPKFSDTEKIHLLKELVALKISFLPLQNGFYTNKNVLVDTEFYN